MYIFRSPGWISRNLKYYKSYQEIPTALFKRINSRLALLQRKPPVVSIVIPAWNEERNILNCIASLSNLETKIPLEIIVINNKSTDNTQKIIDNLDIRTFFQEVEGCGPARQLGQERARGKYILLADADCIYPKGWVDKMIEGLQKDNVACVYGRYSFLSEDGYPRWKLFFWETLRDIIAEYRHFKRPYLNSYGMSMGYLRELGMKIGFVEQKVRGEDGRLCFDLMSFGKVKQVKSRSARVWTPPRTFQQDGSLNKALVKRIKRELKRATSMLSAHPPHNTKLTKK